MQFDDVYETVGMFGPYQKVKYFLLCCTNLLPPVMVYAWTFIAATPSFRCKPPIDDILNTNLNDSSISWAIPDPSQCSATQKHISVRECQRCFLFINRTDPLGSTNQLTSCQYFTFDHTYYQSTIVEDWSMVCDRVSLKSTVQIVFFAGYMVGSLIFGILSDKYGRRPIMGVSFLLMFVAGIVCALAPEDFIGYGTSYPLFATGRFFVACATRGIAVTGFVIGSEIVGPKQRLFAGIVIKYFFAFGELLLLAIAINIRTWRTLNAVLAVVPVPFIFFYFILPESPRWLVSKQRYEDAEKLLRHIAERNKRTFDEEQFNRFVSEDKKRTMAQAGEGSRWKAIFRSKVMAIIAINMSYQWFVQNIVFYGISQNTGAWLKNPYLSFGIAAIVELAAYGVAHMTLDRVGRKIPYCSFVVALASVALLVVPIQIMIPKDQQVLIVGVNILLKFLASGSYVIIYIYANETFPTQGRNTGMGVCSMIGRLGAIIGTFSNDHLTRVWVHFPIILYGVTSLFAVCLATVFPETLDEPLPQTIEDVEQMGLACSFRTPNRKHPGHANGGHDHGEDALLKTHLKDGIDC